ncbi:MAG: hypothetical protein AB7P69_17050 [Candidatus Binatia bacterium]
MAGQQQGIRSTVVILSLGLILGVGAAAWITQCSPTQETQAYTTSQHDHRLRKLEQAMTALTQALQAVQTNNAPHEPTQVTAPANTEVSRQDLAQLIRNEVRHAVTEASPENQRAREEAIVNAEVLNSPENRVAYQSASDVVHTAVAAKRWTEEDKETFRDAFALLTNDQRMELMNILAPAINNGEIKVEVSGPLF